MIIREEKPSDVESIREVNTDAFEANAEARLVDALRDSGCEFISLVAETNNKVTGHILFTPVELTGSDNSLKLTGLGPMAVLSQYQNKGIGSQLVEAGLERCRFLGYDAVFVLGHPHYYPRFGFVPAVQYGIKSEYDVPDDVFMVLELTPGVLKNHEGIVKYHDLFNSV